MKNISRTSYLTFVACTSLVLLPSCKLFESGQEQAAPAATKTTKAVQKPKPAKVLTGEVLVSINGAPLITTDLLEKEKEKLFKSNPQIKSMMAFMDEKQFDRNLSEGLMNQAIVDRYISDNGIDKQADYQAELAEGYEAIERMINTKYFSQNFSVTVSAAEARTFYEKNKDLMPNLLISRGGVAAKGVEFADKAKAQDFLAKVTQVGDVDKAAEQAALTDKVKDFKLVHQQSLGMDAALRDKIVAMKAVPAAEIFTINDKFWVVRASKKEESKYRPFEQVEADIKQFLEKEKRTEAFDEEINQLKAKYNVEINEDYFKTEEIPQEAPAPAQRPAAETVKSAQADTPQPSANKVA